mmetsp:Transcript_13128/g.42782  ORF Transcript_13128/g.42782 Transcript_13128/m.42782 type:complete len:228 (-) Transcript_13128:328-1011(-)
MILLVEVAVAGGRAVGTLGPLRRHRGGVLPLNVMRRRRGGAGRRRRGRRRRLGRGKAPARGAVRIIHLSGDGVVITGLEEEGVARGREGRRERVRRRRRPGRPLEVGVEHVDAIPLLGALSLLHRAPLLEGMTCGMIFFQGHFGSMDHRQTEAGRVGKKEDALGSSATHKSYQGPSFFPRVRSVGRSVFVSSRVAARRWAVRDAKSWTASSIPRSRSSSLSGRQHSR